MAYNGPTEAVDVVVRRVNANAAGVASLWSDVDYSASLVDPVQHRTTDLSGDGTLLFRRPASLVLTGFKDVAGPVFEVGTNAAEFWVKTRSGADAWDYRWGHLANAGKPCCRSVPIRPDLVVEVLGVGLLRTDLLEQPTPVMRFDNEQDAYVFDFNVRRPDRWVLQKQVWYDRATALPRRVALFDDNGRLVLRADLSRPAPLDGPDGRRQPRVARHYDLFVPDNGSTVALTLTDPVLSHPVNRLVSIPNDASFDRPEPDGNNKVTQVDAGCGGSTDGVIGEAVSPTDVAVLHNRSN